MTPLPLRHAELDSASQRETLKQVQGDVEKKRDPETSRVKHETLKRVQGDVEKKRDPEINSG